MAETQKEAFRKYLETAGVIDALTKGTRRVPVSGLRGPRRPGTGWVCTPCANANADATTSVPQPVHALAPFRHPQCWCRCTRSRTSPRAPLSARRLRYVARARTLLPPTRPLAAHPRADRPAPTPTRTPRSRRSYIKSCLGGPTPAEYDAVVAENEALKTELADARATIADLQVRAGGDEA